MRAKIFKDASLKVYEKAKNEKNLINVGKGKCMKKYVQRKARCYIMVKPVMNVHETVNNSYVLVQGFFTL